MSADTTEQNSGGGEDLRARYLPVSRKELRRRREAELAARRAAQEEAEATSDALAAGDAQPDETQDAQLDSSASDIEEEPALEESERTLTDTEAAEAAELPRPPHRGPDRGEDDVAAEPPAQWDQAVPDESEDAGDDVTEIISSPVAEDESEVAQGAEDRGEDAEEADLTTDPETDQEAADQAEADSESAQTAQGHVPDEAVLPEPVEAEEPARPEEDLADAAEETAPDGEISETPDVELSEEDAALLAAAAESEDITDEDDADDQEERSDSGTDSEASGMEFIDHQSAPIPASRRARRLLRETASLPKLDPELAQELQSTTAEIARNDDPSRVDPELLKKQQALAAKAMQANQERLRKQQIEAEREARRRRRERPESAVITGRAVRESLDRDPEEVEYFTGQIEPVNAQGAHGLDLNKMVDATSRQVDRQSVLTWLVIVLAVLLLIAVGVVLYFVLL